MLTWTYFLVLENPISNYYCILINEIPTNKEANSYKLKLSK